MSAARVIGLDELPATATARELVGADHGGAGVCLIFVDAPPGHGPSLHRHPYEEIFIVQEGDVLFTVGERTIEAGPGDIIVVPARAPHKFLSRGERHRQLSIHPAARMETEWLE